MRIPGFLEPRFSPPAPSIAAEVESQTLGIRRPLVFLIDTGASVTVLLDRDVERLGIDWDGLARAKRQLGGIGGFVETRVIKDPQLFFKTSRGETVKERVAVYAVRHDLRLLDRRTRRSVMLMPSLLGRDILENYKLVYDRPRNRVYLED